MSQPSRRVHEPTAAASGPPRKQDWRGVDLPPALETARAEARAAVGRAIEQGLPPAPGAAAAWASAELAVFVCLDRALDQLYASLGAPRPSPSGIVADLVARERTLAGLVERAFTAPDARTRYVFLEDLLHRVAR